MPVLTMPSPFQVSLFSVCYSPPLPSPPRSLNNSYTSLGASRATSTEEPAAFASPPA